VGTAGYVTSFVERAGVNIRGARGIRAVTKGAPIMMNYLLLACAIVAEVIGTIALKASDGFTRLAPSILVVVGYGAAFVLMAQLLKFGMPVGTVYAIWASTGIALVAVAGFFLFGEALSGKSLAGIALIIAGVVLVEAGHG
jgi:small multidrug resistance pump